MWQNICIYLQMSTHLKYTGEKTDSCGLLIFSYFKAFYLKEPTQVRVAQSMPAFAANSFSHCCEKMAEILLCRLLFSMVCAEVQSDLM